MFRSKCAIFAVAAVSIALPHSSFARGGVHVHFHVNEYSPRSGNFLGRLPAEGARVLITEAIAPLRGPALVDQSQLLYVGKEVPGTLDITEADVPKAPAVVHAQTMEEWRTQCKTEGTLAGTGWGFCLLSKNLIASN